MTGQDVLVTAAERGVGASESEVEGSDILKVLRVFKGELLGEVREGDVAGVLAPAYLFRGGKHLGGGLALALQDRVVFGWLRGILKRPTIAVVPLASISSVESTTKAVGGHAPPMPTIAVSAGEDWELVQSPDVPAEAPLYDILHRLLDGNLRADELPAVEGEPTD